MSGIHVSLRACNVETTRRNARGKVWGSDEINVEGWKPLKRLQGHESGMYFRVNLRFTLLTFTPDVTDVAWSPGDRYLASVGLDSAVIVWCGFTLGTLFSTSVYQKLTVC